MLRLALPFVLLVACRHGPAGEQDGSISTGPGTGTSNGDGGSGDDSGGGGGDGGTTDTTPPDDTGLTEGMIDADGDGYTADEDCDDSDPELNVPDETDCNDGLDGGCPGSVAPCGWGSREVDAASAATAILYGESAGDNAGVGVALGDLNADGVVDAVVGAQNGPDETGGDRGAVYVVFGPLSGELDLGTDGIAIRQDGAGQQGYLGRGVRVDDLNADGIDDLIASDSFHGYESTWANDTLQWDAAGMTYAWLGPITSSRATADADFSFEYDGTAWSNYTLSETLDINDDSLMDLALAPGCRSPYDSIDASVAARIVLGPLTGAFDSLSARPTVTLTGTATLTDFSRRSSDLDGDGIDDLLVSPHIGSPPSRGIHVVLGPLSGTYALEDVGITYYTEDANWAFTGSTLAVGDADGDGLADIAVGASTENDLAGAAYLVLGPATKGGSLEDAFATKVVGNPSSEDPEHLANAEPFMHDINGDGEVDWWLTSLAPSGFGSAAALIFSGPIPNGTLSSSEADVVVLDDAEGNGPGQASTDYDPNGSAGLLAGAGASSRKWGLLTGAAYFFASPRW